MIRGNQGPRVLSKTLENMKKKIFFGGGVAGKTDQNEVIGVCKTSEEPERRQGWGERPAN